MNDTAIVTCFYTNLHGTKFGGRQDRHYHYLHSLASLLKITNADFIIYCDPLQEAELKAFVEPIVKTKVTIFPYSLEDFYMKRLFDNYKDFEQVVVSQRCQEIQYLKSYWMNEVENYDYVFWIDVGISYSGLIPYRHMILKENAEFEYFDSVLFCNELIDGMKNAAQDKILFFAINNEYPVMYRTLVFDCYNGKSVDNSYHIIAGIFGGRRNNVINFHTIFEKTARQTIKRTQQVHDEESIYNIIWHRMPDVFHVKRFEMWWHEDNLHSIYAEEPYMIEEVKHLKSFYHTLEDLIKLGKQS